MTTPAPDPRLEVALTEVDQLQNQADKANATLRDLSERVGQIQGTLAQGSGGPTWFDSLQLIITFLTAVAAFAAVLATFRVHQLSAGRVFVGMAGFAYMPFNGTESLAWSEEGGKELPRNARPGVSLAEGPPRMEFAEIAIENPGRQGVTITSVKLRVEGTGEKRRVQSATRFSLKKSNAAYRSDSYFRLEPFEKAALLLDVWSVVDAVLAEHPDIRSIKVAAEVTAAGHRKLFSGQPKPFSSEPQYFWQPGTPAWEFHRTTLSLVQGQSTRRFVDLLLTELLRGTTTDLNQCKYMGNLVKETCEELRRRKEGWTQDDLVAALASAKEKYRVFLSWKYPVQPIPVAENVWGEINRLHPDNIVWGDVPRPAG